MKIEEVARYASNLPADDDHPYRTGAWAPNHVEYDAWDLEVEGRVPADLNGFYLRNTENPLHASLGRYHPFDGDGMLHAVCFEAGEVRYRNRFVRTAGFEAERAEGRALWAGLIENPARSERDGWGARGLLKDSSSTDVIVHGGRALSTFYQCGQVYELDPRNLETLGTADWEAGLLPGWGVSAHPKLDEASGELLFFNYSKQAPYMNYGVVDASRNLVHHVPIELPGPRLPHDMAFTDNYAILNDFPMFWDPAALEKGVHAVRFYPDLPSRFAVIPRRGQPDQVRWFEADPTFVLHFINAYEDGDEVVLDGFFEDDPMPGPREGDSGWDAIFRFLDFSRMRPRAHRWRFNLKTGQTRESELGDSLLEFGMINNRFGGRRHRFTYATRTKPGWFLFNSLVRLDVETGALQELKLPDGVYASESPMAPRDGSSAEDDGYVLTLISDTRNDRSECWVLDAADIAAGPLAKIALPARISAGTHACWAPESAL